MTTITTPVTEQDRVIDLPDGRKLGYARYGLPGGSPVFYFHGGNSSRLEGLWFDEAARLLGVDLIAPDRPGFGLSDFQPGRRILDWPGDLAYLIDSLGIKTCAAIGLSGGAPFALAAALKLPERIQRLAVVSGVAPPEMPGLGRGMWLPGRMIFWMARYLPPANKLFLSQMSKFYANREQMVTRMAQTLPEPDVALLKARPEVFEIFSASAQEAHRNGVQGDAWEWGLYVRPWGFDLEAIQAPVSLWYGQYDQTAPLGMGQYYASRLRSSRLEIVPDGGHFSTINNHIKSILRELLDAPA